MKNYRRIMFLAAGTCGVVVAQPVAVPTPMRSAAPPAPNVAQVPSQLRPAAEVDQLVAPIALYPDALIGVMLPASTRPADLSAAAGLANSGATAAQIEAQPWDDSVKALTQYPDVAQWMAENVAWTEELGVAFQLQPAEVMNSIQRLRTEARTNGVLASTPQQQVVVQDNYISIVPMHADTVYVPYYDPQIIRTRAPRGTVAVRFGQPVHVGVGVAFGMDWRNRNVWYDRGPRVVRPESRVVVHSAPAAPVRHEIWRPSGPPPPTVVVHGRPVRGEIPRPTLFTERNYRGPGAPAGAEEIRPAPWAGWTRPGR